jgi:hypothetical protein
MSCGCGRRELCATPTRSANGSVPPPVGRSKLPAVSPVRRRLLPWCRCGASPCGRSHKSPGGRVGLGGLEPPTSALSVLRSNQLSYSPGIGPA